MTYRQDLLSKPYFDVGRNVLERVSSVYIIPNRRKHESGYNCMDMVATLEDGTQYRIVKIMGILLLSALPCVFVVAVCNIACYLHDIAEVLRNPSWHLTIHEKATIDEEDEEEEE